MSHTQTLVPKYPKSATFNFFFLRHVDILERSFHMAYGRGHVHFTLHIMLSECVLSVC